MQKWQIAKPLTSKFGCWRSDEWPQESCDYPYVWRARQVEKTDTFCQDVHLIWKLIGLVMQIFHAFLLTWVLDRLKRIKCSGIASARVQGSLVSVSSMSQLLLLICPQVESALHKDHVVTQWQEQISEKKQVGNSSQLSTRAVKGGFLTCRSLSWVGVKHSVLFKPSCIEMVRQYFQVSPPSSQWHQGPTSH